jgi:hypothetical protein
MKKKKLFRKTEVVVTFGNEKTPVIYGNLRIAMGFACSQFTQEERLDLEISSDVHSIEIPKAMNLRLN